MSVITLRTDDVRDRRITELMAETGAPDRSTALREAIDLAWYITRIRRQRTEAEQVAADVDDRAEIAEIHKDMDDLRAW